MYTLRRKIIGDLRAQAGAFLAVWLTIVVGLSFYGATYPAGVAMIESSYATYDLLHYADFTALFAPSTEREAILEALADVPGVVAVEGRLVMDTGLELHAPDRITLQMISLPDGEHPSVNDVQVTKGAELSAPGQVLVLESFANFHAIKPGDTLHVWANGQPHDLVVAGLVFAPEYLIAGQSSIMPFPQPSSFGVAYMPYAEMTDMLGMPGAVNNIVLTTDEDADADAIRSALTSILAPYTTVEHIFSRLQTASGGITNANIDGAMPIASFFSIMFLIISGLVMAVLLARLMEAETRRIGTMRALGLGRKEALRHYSAFPLVIGISGAIVGSIIGYLISFLTAQYFIQTLFGGSLPTFVNPPQWGYILFGAGVVIVLALLAGAIPIWRASGTDPGLALRPVTPKGMGAQGRITIPGLPLSARQALRNMLRVPARTINTLLSVLIGFTVIIAASGMADTSTHVVDIQFRDGQHFDLQVTWSTLAPADPRQAQIADITGVHGVEMVLVGPVTASHGDRVLDTYAISTDHETDYYTFKTLDGEAAFSHGEAVWIGQNLARVLDVGAGDTLTLSALGQTHEARIAGVVEQFLGSVVFTPTELMLGWTPLSVRMSNMAWVQVEPGELDTVRRALTALNGVVAVEVTEQTRQDVYNYVQLYLNFSYIFLAFGYLLTLLVLFNTVSINLHERREELSIMRALGASSGEIARTITWETMVVTIAGMIPAVPLGWQAADWLMKNYQTDFYGLISYIAPRSYILAVVGVIIVVLLAQVPGLRRVRKADLGYLSKTLSM